jgi:phosphate transport system substrate-binding protein
VLKNRYTMKNRALMSLAAVAVGLGGLAAAGCGDDDEGSGGGGGEELSGTITIDGSSTVAPLSEAAAELFQQENPGVRITVGTSGTGGGFEKFCRGETDISDASRQIKEEEIQACEDNGIAWEEVSVANDGLTVAINPENDWATCLTVEEVRKMWDLGSDVNNWSQVRDGFPDVPLTLYGPGTDSGTFDYFTEAINGEEGRIRRDYNNIGEDDNAAVTGVSGERGGSGFIPLSFVEENTDKVKAAEIDNGDGCVAPSLETVQNGTYTPLGRQLFVYPSDKSLARPEVLAFLEFYIERNDEIAERALFIPLNDEQRQEALDKVASLAGGGTETAE